MEADFITTYKSMIESLEPYMELTFVSIWEKSTSPYIVGKLKQNFLRLPVGMNVSIFVTTEYDDPDFILYVTYISQEDLDIYHKNGNKLSWYENIFVPGKLIRKCIFYSEDKRFDNLSATTDIPIRAKVEALIDIEKVNAEISLEAPYLKTKASQIYTNNNDKIVVKKRKIVADSEIYTLGKLKKDFLGIPSGYNILIEWDGGINYEDIEENGDSISNINIDVYYISEEDKKKFHNSQNEHLWYQHVFVPGKIYKSFTTHMEKIYEHDKDPSFIKHCINHFLISEPIKTYQFNNPKVLYYGITLSDFLFVPKNYILVMIDGPKYITFAYISAEIDISQYGIGWFWSSICIIGKKYKCIDRNKFNFSEYHNGKSIIFSDTKPYYTI